MLYLYTPLAVITFVYCTYLGFAMKKNKAITIVAALFIAALWPIVYIVGLYNSKDQFK